MPGPLPKRPAAGGKDKRSGAALVFAALSCLVLVPMLGLAVDGANVYLVRNRLNTALSAAVLAGARSLNSGQGVSVAQMVFNANVSNLSSTNISITPPTFAQTGSGVIVSISGQGLSATVPLTFMGLIVPSGNTVVNIPTVTAQRPKVNMMLVLDQSHLMGLALSGMQANANTILNLFVNDGDSLGLVGFTAAPYVVDSLTQNFQANIPNDINSLLIPDGMAQYASDLEYSVTNTAAAMSVAYQQLQALNQPGAVNLIVLITNSSPGAFSGDFAGLVSPMPQCNPNPGPVKGVLWTDWTGEAGGLSDWQANIINDMPEARWAPACNTPAGTNPRLLYSPALNGMPSTDIYNNSTNGTGSISPPYIPTGSLSPVNPPNIIAASINALDDAANQIRGNATLPAKIFVIGMTNPNPQLDSTLMQRIANVTGSINAAQPAGQFLWAPTTAQVQSAFAPFSRFELTQ